MKAAMRLFFVRRVRKGLLLAACACLAPFCLQAQAVFKKFGNLFTVPRSYVVNYVSVPPAIDGDITDPAWGRAAWTENFRDIEGSLKPDPPLRTRAKMLWDDNCLYIAAEIDEPNVWATLKQHDQVVFHDNDFEVFINPNNTAHQYFELEFNALNTVFDLFMNKPYRNGGSAMINWDAQGLRSAVKVRGSLNNPGDTDTGWTIEIAIPFKAISIGNDVQIPADGSVWRINFSRVEWDVNTVDGKYVKATGRDNHDLPEHNWVWSAQGVVNMHYPERWGYLQFSKEVTADKPFVMPYAELQKRYLWLVYYREEAWQNLHHAYNGVIKKFGLKRLVDVNGHINTLQIEATRHQFMALITDKNDKITRTINQEGLISRLK